MINWYLCLQACKLAIRESIEADIRKEREREETEETDMVTYRFCFTYSFSINELYLTFLLWFREDIFVAMARKELEYMFKTT